MLYRVSPDGEVTRWLDGFGRPQGLAFDAQGVLHVVDALAGDSVVYRIAADGSKTVVVSGAGLLGIAFDPDRRRDDRLHRRHHLPDRYDAERRANVASDSSRPV